MNLEPNNFILVINITTALITITNSSFVLFKQSNKEQIGRILLIKVNKKSVSLKINLFPILEDLYRSRLSLPLLYKYNIREVYQSSTYFTINKLAVFDIVFVLKLNGLENNNIEDINNCYILRYSINNSNKYKEVSVDKYKIFLYSYYEFKYCWIQLGLKEIWNSFNTLRYAIQLYLFSS